MSKADRAIVQVLQVASDTALKQLPPFQRVVAQTLSDQTFALLLSLISRIEQLEGKKL